MLRADSPLPARMTREARDYLIARFGNGFHANEGLRVWWREQHPGSTMEDAAQVWLNTKDVRYPIKPHFHYNRFIQQWHAANHGSHADAVAAWHKYRRRDDT